MVGGDCVVVVAELFAIVVVAWLWSSVGGGRDDERGQDGWYLSPPVPRAATPNLGPTAYATCKYARKGDGKEVEVNGSAKKK